MRVDNSATYGKSCVATAGTTTTLTDATNLSEAADFWKGGTVVITSGQNKGYSAHIDDFASGVITFSPALKEACDAGDTFRVVTSTGITSTNVITCSAVERAVALLKYFNAPTYDGKYYIGIISPFVQYDFMQDSAWVNAHHYAQDTALFDGEVGRWGGVRWVEDTDPWLEAAGTIGTYAGNGTVHQTPIFGRHSYAGVGIEGVPDKLFIKKPGDQDTSNYINAYSMVAWRVYFVPVVLNALFGVTLVSGASTIA
jgi:N4-gp56 family major capsid protein